jgi:hypothetical protein
MCVHVAIDQVILVWHRTQIIIVNRRFGRCEHSRGCIDTHSQRGSVLEKEIWPRPAKELKQFDPSPLKSLPTVRIVPYRMTPHLD